MSSLSQLGLIYVYLLVIILLVGLGYAGFRLVNWAVTKIASSTAGAQKPSVKGPGNDPDWMRLAFLSATILFLAIFAGGMFKVMGVGEGGHDHQAHAQASGQSSAGGQSQANPSNQMQLLQPNQYQMNQYPMNQYPVNQYPMNQYQMNQYQMNQYQIQNQLDVLSSQLSQIETQLDRLSN